MYRRIMVPVDLAHLDRLEKALTTAGDLAKLYRIPVTFVGVTSTAPSEVARTPEEYSARLTQFGADQAEKHGLSVATAALVSHDPAVDLDNELRRAVEDSGADLVVMASHLPGLPEHLFSSHAGALASHAKVSVFVVR